MAVTAIFTNNSANAASYLWDFGDGSHSTLVAPTHTYGASGIYIVRMTATGPGGTAISEQPIAVQTGSPINFLSTSGLDQLTDNEGNELTVG